MSPQIGHSSKRCQTDGTSVRLFASVYSQMVFEVSHWSKLRGTDNTRKRTHFVMFKINVAFNSASMDVFVITECAVVLLAFERGWRNALSFWEWFGFLAQLVHLRNKMNSILFIKRYLRLPHLRFSYQRCNNALSTTYKFTNLKPQTKYSAIKSR